MFGCNTCYNPCTPLAPCTCQSVTPLSTPSGPGISVQNSWVVPAVGYSAELDAPLGAGFVAAGGYLWNGSYGYLRISAVNNVTGKITVTNDHLPGTAPAGTPIPANTYFVLAPGSFTQEEGTWALQVITEEAMNFVLSAIDSAKYTLDGNLVHMSARFKGSFNGIPRPECSINLPFPGVQTGDTKRTQAGICIYDENNTIANLAVFYVNSNAPTSNIRKQGFADYVLGVNYVFNVAVTYVRDH